MVTVRCLIDSMVFDAIAADPELLRLVDRLTRARRLELLAAAETMVELAAVPDEDHRRRLRRVRVLVVPPAEPDPAFARQRGVSDEDARIASAAAREGVPLVTEDRDLREAVRFLLPATPVWTFAADLLPRIVAISG
jgi:predicted nucleic acid-binding protein